MFSSDILLMYNTNQLLGFNWMHRLRLIFFTSSPMFFLIRRCLFYIYFFRISYLFTVYMFIFLFVNKTTWLNNFFFVFFVAGKRTLNVANFPVNSKQQMKIIILSGEWNRFFVRLFFSLFRFFFNFSFMFCCSKKSNLINCLLPQNANEKKNGRFSIWIWASE